MDNKPPIALITRHCACGCGNTFRVLPTSLQQYCSATHDPSAKRDLWLFNDKAVSYDPSNGGMLKEMPDFKIEVDTPQENEEREIIGRQK